MSGSRDRLDDPQRTPPEGVRRWGPLLAVVVALVVVLVAVATAVYVGRITEPLAPSGLTPPPATSRHLGGQRCIALDLMAVGAPAAKVGRAYRLRVLVGDNGGPCVLEPTAVKLLAEGRGGAQQVIAAPAAAVRAGPQLVVDYEVTFGSRCTARAGSDAVLLSVGGSPLNVSGASIPRGLESCRPVTMSVSAYR